MFAMALLRTLLIEDGAKRADYFLFANYFHLIDSAKYFNSIHLCKYVILKKAFHAFSPIVVLFCFVFVLMERRK